MSKKMLITLIVAYGMLFLLVGFPAASVEDHPGVSSDGSPDILLLNHGQPIERLAVEWHPDGVLEEMRALVLTDSVRHVLARYPNFLAPDEAERLGALLLLEGERNGIDPLFLAAVIRVESAFSSDAISDKGARGLMQVMPATGAEMAQQLGITWSGPDGLHDPETNLMLGVHYLRMLLDRYQGSYRRALTAYNRGPRNLRYIESRHGRLRHQFTEYFRKIQDIYEQYQRSLGPGAALLQVG